ncbi:MAG: putative translocase FtsK, partial [Planctomycetota bacterium]
MAKTARTTPARRRASGAASDVTSSNPGVLAWLRAAWVLAAGALLLTVLSLASFDAADPPSFAVAIPNDPPANLCGKVGAAVAHRLYEVFGVGVWIPVCFLGALLGFRAAGRPMSHPFVRFIGACVLMIAAGGLHQEWFPHLGPVPGYQSGLIPMSLALELHEHFGFGASVILLVMMAMGAVVMADTIVALVPGAIMNSLAFLSPVWKFDWSGAIASLRERIGALAPRPAVATTGARARRGAAAKATAVTEVEAEEEEEEAEFEDEAEDEAGDDAADAEVEDEYEYEYEDASEDENEDDDEDCEDDAEDDEESAANSTPIAPRSDAELREQLSKLPVRVNRTSPAATARDTDIPRTVDYSGYRFPGLDLLDNPEGNYAEEAERHAQDQAVALTRSLETYGLRGEIKGIECGPVVTVYSVELEAGTRVARLETISKDVARALKAQNIRVIPNMKGTDCVGIEVPNPHKEMVRLKELMSGGEAAGMALPMFLGKDSAGDPLVLDLAKMPHMLIAGT